MLGLFKRKREGAAKEIDRDRIPKHVGVIMDGNGRWARAKGLPRSAGHKYGAVTLENITEYCGNLGIKVVTAYAFSTENWKRPEPEVKSIMELLYDYLVRAEEKFRGTNVRLNIIGERSIFDSRIRTAMASAERVTGKNDGMTLNIAVNYGGRDEIIRAARAAARDVQCGKVKPEEIDEEYLSGKMYTSGQPEVDLIIRPSGELRLSNFLLWQAAYAEFWFSNINWPAFTERDMERAIIEFQDRNRRFGGV